jgi:hypothetical protein
MWRPLDGVHPAGVVVVLGCLRLLRLERIETPSTEHIVMATSAKNIAFEDAISFVES